ncbi:MAG: hypothetical protein HY508_13130 [Acidobacteria bacterium]|nr:hypothetical protein [Acidobacteriota bacterium]
MMSLATFDVTSSTPFFSKENYEALGITARFEGEKLVGLQVTIEHDEDTEYEKLVAEANRKIVRLLQLIEFGTGVPLQIGPARIGPLESESLAAICVCSVKANATLTIPIPLPPPEMVAKLRDEELRQLAWYNSAAKSSLDVEKIRSFYQVLELEKQLTGGSYLPPPEMTYLRHAVSHPQLGDESVKEYLRANNLHSDHIDLSNTSHVDFIKARVEPLRQEARRVIEKRLPKWW